MFTLKLSCCVWLTLLTGTLIFCCQSSGNGFHRSLFDGLRLMSDTC